MSSSIRSLLESLVTAEALVPEEELKNWRVGAGEEGLPDAVVAPSSDDEIAQVLGRASREGWKVLPAGLGSWLEGGGPADVSLVISTRRMKEVHEYEPADLTFTAGAGLSLRELREITGANGQWLPLDPPGGDSGSLGAAVATASRGSLGGQYGTARDHVLGLTMVSGGGRILRWGGKVVKNVAGFDLTRLTIGSWGSLGVVTSVSARLFPIPEADVTLLLRGAKLRALLLPARAMALSSLPLAAVELVDPLPDETLASVGGVEPGPPGALVLRLLGSQTQVTAMEARIRAELPDSLGALEKLEGHGSGFFHEKLNRWEEGQGLVARLSLLPSELDSLFGEAEEMRSLAATQPGISAAAGGEPSVHLSAQVGTGVLRVAVPRVSADAETSKHWAGPLQDLRARLEGQGGTLTLSSGPGPIMREVGAWGTPGPEGRLMARLKAQFDPEGILAPGRLGL